MIRSKLSSWREYLTPVSHKSTFLSSGQITPEEFTQAGDYLVHTFPTWKWNESSKDVSVRDFLPPDKQFLVTRKVTCEQRSQQLVEMNEEVSEPQKDQDGWYISGNNATTNKNSNNDSNTTMTDIDEMMEEMAVENNNDDIVDTPTVDPGKRFYDLFITYSTSYRVPKMYIVGYNAEGSPLTAEQMFEDISPDYREKTATIEKLPFYKLSVLSVSIHPCKHANVMKILMDKVRVVKQRRRLEAAAAESNETDEWEDLQNDIDDTLRVDQYLVVFLKFITSVIPGIQHDYTMESW